MNGRHIAIIILITVSIVLAVYTYFQVEPGSRMAMNYIVAGAGFAISAVLAAMGKQED